VIVAVLSGKGGTGKTTVAVNLALSIGEELCFLDCDVEEPNAHLLLHPKISKTTPVYLPVPVFQEGKCNSCGRCVEVCAYNALALIGDAVLVFAEMCHGCGGCTYFCPTGALTEGQREIGVITEGRAGKVIFGGGRLRVGEALVPPLIKNLRRREWGTAHTIIDCPPGASCPVVHAVRGVDFGLVVTEPTPFGRHDLEVVVAMLDLLGIAAGVVINKADLGDSGVRDFCRERGLPVLAEIPFDLEIARAGAAGTPFTERLPAWRDAFHALWREIGGIVGRARDRGAQR